MAGEVSRQLFCEMVKEIQVRKAWVMSFPDDQKSEMGIYQIRCLVNGKVYVGCTVNFHVRWVQHKGVLKRNKHHSHRLQNAWNKYGSNAFVYEVLEYVYEPDILSIVEDEYIKRLEATNRKFGFNVTMESGRVSEEVRERMSESHLGKKHSLETRKKIGDAHRGSKRSKESIKKRLVSHALKKELGLTEEEYRNKSNAVLLEYNGEVRTQSEWARIRGIHLATLRDRLCSGWSVEQALTIGAEKKQPVLLEYNGEVKTQSEWARIKGIPLSTLYNRLRRGWGVEKALTI